MGSLIHGIRETEFLKLFAQCLAFNRSLINIIDLPFKDASCSRSQALDTSGNGGWKRSGSSSRAPPAFRCRLADLPSLTWAGMGGGGHAGAQVRPGTCCSMEARVTGARDHWGTPQTSAHIRRGPDRSHRGARRAYRCPGPPSGLHTRSLAHQRSPLPPSAGARLIIINPPLTLLLKLITL